MKFSDINLEEFEAQLFAPVMPEGGYVLVASKGLTPEQALAFLADVLPQLLPAEEDEEDDNEADEASSKRSPFTAESKLEMAKLKNEGMPTSEICQKAFDCLDGSERMPGHDVVLRAFRNYYPETSGDSE